MNQTHDYIIRRVVEADIDLLFSWANDEEVRLNSINTKKILPEEHKEWFSNFFLSSDRFIFILEIKAIAAGQIRFDYNTAENVWEIGYLLAKDFRGKGLSKILVEKGIASLNKYPVVAYVKPENIKSIRVFESLNFSKLGIYEIKHTNLVKFIKRCQ